MERTLTIIKPDAVKRNLIGKITARLEEKGFKILAGKIMHLTDDQAKAFYAVHAERPFYNDLVEFMTSEKVFVMALEREKAVEYLREVIGATDPAEAAEGTVRKDFAESKQNNCIHASDSVENAGIELSFFFPESEIILNK